ncbi:hypothetical protein [Novosphingobium sp.]|uniref:hypothetical protein n=1 Tax=Novosphingobium sp. TaxID=1874826 RepID=UPI003D14AE2B
MRGLGLIAVLTLWGCTPAAKAPAPGPCAPDAVLSADAPRRGIPVEQTPAGRCMADRAEAGDIAAGLKIGDFYLNVPGTLPLIDRKGHELHWFRLAGDHGDATGAWAAAQLIDNDRDRQVPNDALAYLIVAIKGGIPEAGDYIVDQWQDGRVDPGKIWALRRWLDQPGVLPEDQRVAIIAGLNAPADDLLYE